MPNEKIAYFIFCLRLDRVGRNKSKTFMNYCLKSLLFCNLYHLNNVIVRVVRVTSYKPPSACAKSKDSIGHDENWHTQH